VSSQRFTPEFKEEAVRQVVERGYGVPDVAARLGVSAHSLYKWIKAVSPNRSEQQSQELLEAKSEVRRLRSQLRRVEEERNVGGSGSTIASAGGLDPTGAAPVPVLRRSMPIKLA
jgi:transposase